jgi:hypothetical protein
MKHIVYRALTWIAAIQLLFVLTYVCACLVAWRFIPLQQLDLLFALRVHLLVSLSYSCGKLAERFLEKHGESHDQRV